MKVVLLMMLVLTNPLKTKYDVLGSMVGVPVGGVRNFVFAPDLKAEWK